MLFRQRGLGHTATVRPEQEDYVERVLVLVESVPPGRVTTYGAIADVVGGGARRVGTVMAHHGGGVPWWRVVRADGSLPPSHTERARERYATEGTPMRGDRVAMADAFIEPAEPGPGPNASPPGGPR